MPFCSFSLSQQSWSADIWRAHCSRQSKTWFSKKKPELEKKSDFKKKTLSFEKNLSLKNKLSFENIWVFLKKNPEFWKKSELKKKREFWKNGQSFKKCFKIKKKLGFNKGKNYRYENKTPNLK